LKTSFFQIQLPPALRDAFVILDGQTQKAYRFCRLPMGYAYSVRIMQSVLEAFYERCFPPATPALYVDLYVDNGLVVLRTADVESAIARIKNVAHEMQVTLGEINFTSGGPTSIEHRGVQIDMQARTIALKPSMCQKIRDRADWFRRSDGAIYSAQRVINAVLGVTEARAVQHFARRTSYCAGSTSCFPERHALF
jgi:hypothetical protein